jgi:hypothetical protein
VFRADGWRAERFRTGRCCSGVRDCDFPSAIVCSIFGNAGILAAIFYESIFRCAVPCASLRQCAIECGAIFVWRACFRGFGGFVCFVCFLGFWCFGAGNEHADFAGSFAIACEFGADSRGGA